LTVYCLTFSLLGELTDQGRLSTSMLGQRLRKLYVDQLGFLPKSLDEENVLYCRFVSHLFLTDVRTSHIQRTIESLTEVFSGLYPHEYRHVTPSFNLRLVNHENLYPNDDFCAYSL
jgi:acid phosphatase